MATGTSAANRGTTERQRTVVGVFDGPNHAERALNQLKDAGFSPDQVSVVAKDNRETRGVVESTGMGEEGAASGAVAGSILGGVAGWLVGISALVIPGIGPIVGAGVIASTLAGAGLGAAAGGLIGALVGYGVPEEEARGYEEHVRRGSILLTVHARDDDEARRAHELFGQGGGADVRAYGVEGGRDSGGASTGIASAAASTTTRDTSASSGRGGQMTGDNVVTSSELREGDARPSS